MVANLTIFNIFVYDTDNLIKSKASQFSLVKKYFTI